MKREKNELLWFVCLALPITWVIGLIPWPKGGLSVMAEMLSMYIPALTVILLYWLRFKKPVFKKSDLNFRFKGWKYWIIAPFVLSTLCIISYLFSWLVNPRIFSTLEEIAKSLQSKGMFIENVFVSLPLVFLLNGVLGCLLDLPMFLGEEIGWRGFMMPRLFRLMNPKIAFVVGGIVWGLWHIVMISKGLNYPDHPIAGAAMMILLSIPLGLIIQYFYYKSGSIFVAALAHAALNKSAMSMSFIICKEALNPFLFGPTGITGIAIFSITAAWMFSRIDWNQESVGQINTHDNREQNET